VTTKLEIRDFDSKAVPNEVKLRVLEAARLSPSGMNVQSWRFILVEGREDLRKLADDSTTGKWVEGAAFAVIVLTMTKPAFHLIDAGRAVQNMQVAAWNSGVVSCVFSGLNLEALQRDFNIPAELNPSIIVGFGYPKRRIVGKKKRKPLKEIVFLNKYGNEIEIAKVRDT
jgi:nitroreductase